MARIGALNNNNAYIEHLKPQKLKKTRVAYAYAYIEYALLLFCD
jgi:hypothetical protein